MPHLKVKQFDTDMLDDIIENDDNFLFRAKRDADGSELIGVVQDEEEFILQIKTKNNEMLIKPDPISRPADILKIKKALMHFSELTKCDVVHSNIDIRPNKPKSQDGAYKKISDFINPVFPLENVAVEVGFGSGRHLLYQAKENPDTLFVGIEIHTPSIEQVLKQISLQNLDNIWVVNYDARLILEMLPSNILSDIFVHFPVPWDKKPHRRVISEQFITEALRALRPGGNLELRTDSPNYYEYSKSLFSSFNKAKLNIEKNSQAVITSKYEDRWRAQNKDIYTLTLTARDLSEAIEYDFDFSFDNSSNADKLFLDLMPKKALVFEDYFVHFEGKYCIGKSNEMLIKCAFGSFDRPEHRYLKIGTTSKYYPNDPVPSNLNHKAHIKIGEMIYG